MAKSHPRMFFSIQADLPKYKFLTSAENPRESIMIYCFSKTECIFFLKIPLRTSK